MLYDRDHYKLALGQINVARHLIDNLAKDYTRLLKYGDSLFRCKQLKRAALGRMCTLMSKQRTSLAYLEEVRQHLARLPSIDPNTRTLILTGFPNVGKSSFINKVTHANCEVQPYPFTTKSLFVGHMDYKYLRWQVIDTPGILDHPLEERNTIEMQAVTALAHLHCCVMFFIDISEQCNYTIAQQVALYESIKPLFANKPVCFVANKTDVVPFESLSDENKALLAKMSGERNMPLVPMSNVSEDGIMAVKVAACDKLLEHRVATKLSTKKVDEITNRIHVTMPKPRDTKQRPALVPQSVLHARSAAAAAAAAGGDDIDGDDEEDMLGAGRAAAARVAAFAPAPKGHHPTTASAAHAGAPRRRTMRDIEAEQGGPGVFNLDYRTAHFQLANDEWATDIVPEIMDGKNVADFVDAEIDARLAELEREEDELQRAAEEAGTMGGEDEWDLDEDQEQVLGEIRRARAQKRQEAEFKSNKNKIVIPRTKQTKTLAEFEQHLDSMGIDHSALSARARSSRARSRGGDNDDDDASSSSSSSSSSAAVAAAGDDEGATAEPPSVLGKRRGRSRSATSTVAIAADAQARDRSASRDPRVRSASVRSKSRPASNAPPPGADGMRNVKQKLDIRKLTKKMQEKEFNRHGRLGEADRFVGTKMPRHLFSGTMGIGKRDWR